MADQLSEAYHNAVRDYGDMVKTGKGDINVLMEKYVFYENLMINEELENGNKTHRYYYLANITDLFRRSVADYYTRQTGYARVEHGIWTKCD